MNTNFLLQIQNVIYLNNYENLVINIKIGHYQPIGDKYVARKAIFLTADSIFVYPFNSDISQMTD